MSVRLARRPVSPRRRGGNGLRGRKMLAVPGHFRRRRDEDAEPRRREAARPGERAPTWLTRYAAHLQNAVVSV